ncbi:MAG: hypothetical protein HY268_14355 [Deltaproteobacteria bacterium]|nr:hypothetical protein [Deltaproteobacteria bacterium]
MAEKEYLTEWIKYLSDLLKLSCVFLIAVGGGTLSLLLGELTTTKAVLAVLGTGTTIALVVGGRVLDRQIRESIERLKEI